MKKLSKKLLAVLLTLALVVAVVTVAAFAADPSVASEAELNSAISSAADGSTIKLTGNVTLDSYVTFTGAKSITLDLAGFTLSRTAADGTVIYVEGGAKLTITDSSAAHTGKVAGSETEGSDNIPAINVTGEGTALTIKGGEFTCADTVVGAFDKAAVTIEGANTKITSSKSNAVATNGKYRESGAAVTINGGTIVSATGAGVYLPSGTLTVTDGSIEGQAGIVVRGGELEVTGGTVTAKGTTDVNIGDGDNNKVTPAAVVVNAKDSNVNSNVSIKGGDFVAPEGKTTVSYQDGTSSGDSTAAKKAITVTGGSFMAGETGDDSVEELLPEGNTISATGEIEAGADCEAKIGDVGYKTLKDAIEAAKEGDIVTLAKDVTLPGKAEGTDRITVTKEITLDLGDNKLIKNAELPEGKGGLLIGTNGKLTVTNGTVEGTGTLLMANGASNCELTIEDDVLVNQLAKANPSDDYKANNTAVAGLGDSTVTLKGEVVAAEYGVGVFGTADFVLDGGTVTANGIGISTNGSSTNDGATITVKSGSVKGEAGAYLPKGTMTVEDGTIEGDVGIVVRGGTLEVNGGTVTATGTGTVEIGDANPAIVPAAAVVVDKAATGYTGSNTAELNDGKFTAKDGDAVVFTSAGEPDSANESATLTVKGGEYSSDVNENLLDASLNAKVEKDGTYTYYGSLLDAEAAANAIGGKATELTSAADKAKIVASGFIGTNVDKETRNKLLNDLALKELSKETAISDCDIDTLYVAIKFPANASGTYKVTITKEGMESLNDETELTGDILTKGAIVYASFNNHLSAVGTNGQGKYTVTLMKDNDVIGSTTIEVYKVTYKAGTGVDEAADVTVYTDEAGLKAALNDRPAGFKLSASVNYWVRTEKQEDTYTYTVTYSGKHVNPGSSDHECPGDVFPDMNLDGFYHEAMDFMIKNGYIKGYPDGYLRPNNITTRAETLKILACNAGVTKKDETVWYKNYVQWAVEHGYSDGKRPDDPILREEIVTILWRMAGEPKSTQSLASFKDAGEVNDWARTAMAWAVEKGIMAGRGSTQLAPKGVATRAEVACFIYRFLNLEK